MLEEYCAACDKNGVVLAVVDKAHERLGWEPPKGGRKVRITKEAYEEISRLRKLANTSRDPRIRVYSVYTLEQFGFGDLDKPENWVD